MSSSNFVLMSRFFFVSSGRVKFLFAESKATIGPVLFTKMGCIYSVRAALFSKIDRVMTPWLEFAS